MLRLFTGLTLPADLTARLAALAGGIPAARWVEPANFHITLCFIGEIDEGRAADLDAELAAIRADAFMLELDGLGIFGGAKPHTLWAGIRRAPALLHLQERVEAAILRTGLPVEGRKFTPHVTLARCRGAPTERLQGFILGHSPFRSQPFAVERFVLFQSHLGRGGPVYQTVADYPLNVKWPEPAA